MHVGRSFCLAAAIGLVLGGTMQLGAQEEPRYIEVVRVQVHTDRIADWVAVRKEILAATKEAKGNPFNVWQVVSGNTSEFWIGTPKASFADMEGSSAMQRTLGEAAAQALIARITPTVAHRELGISRFNSRLSIIPEDRSPSNYIAVTHRLNGPGKRRDIGRYYAQKILPEMKKAGVKASFVYSTFSGGSPRQTSFVEPFEKWSDLDESDPVAESMGGEAYGALMYPFWSLFDSEERVILRHRPDLSYQP